MIDALNNPITFILAITLAVTAVQAIVRALAAKAGWTGLAAVFGAK